MRTLTIHVLQAVPTDAGFEKDEEIYVPVNPFWAKELTNKTYDAVEIIFSSAIKTGAGKHLYAWDGYLRKKLQMRAEDDYQTEVYGISLGGMRL